MVRTSRALWWGALASLVVGVIAFASGMAVALHWGNTLPLTAYLGPASTAHRATPGDLREDFKIYWETWSLVERNFYRKEPLKQKEMVYASIEGMLRSLGDDYTFFQRPEAAAETREAMSGQFEGIGAYIEWQEGQLLIVSPIEGSPAERAGMMAGDVVLTVDGADLAPLMIDLDPAAAAKKAASLIRGPKGSTVDLLVLRPSTGEQFELSITRDSIPLISVRAKMLDDGIAYIQITNFKATTTGELDTALKTIMPQKPSGIVLDLRNNPGGYLTTAQEIIGRFVSKGAALYEEFGNGTIEEKPVLRQVGDPKAFDVPMVVLVNGGSASASEIVAGALRDHGRATLLGEKTFGKGSVQIIERLSDSSSARITIAQWLTPGRSEIHKIGLTPEQVVPYLTDDNYLVTMPQKRPTDPATVHDSQLWWAIRVLTTGETPPQQSAAQADH
jgi:carboxyl-terminal processing protease